MPNESSSERKEKGNSLKKWILTLGVAFAVWFGGRVNAQAQGLNSPEGKPGKSPQPTLVINPTDVVPPTITPIDTAVPPTITVDTKATQQAEKTAEAGTRVAERTSIAATEAADRDATATARDAEQATQQAEKTAEAETRVAEKTAEAETRVAEKTAEAGTRVAEKTASAVRTSTGTPTSSPENTATATATRTNTATVSPTIKNPDIFNPPATMTGTSTVTPSITPSITSIADFISPSPTTKPQPIVAGPSSYEQIYGQTKTPKPEQASSISRPKYTKDWSELSTEEQEFLINTNLYREYILKVRKEREERARAKLNNSIKINPIDLAKRRAETQIESQILNSAEWKELISNANQEARKRFNNWLDSYLDKVLKNKPNKPLVRLESK